jgi:RimJ/RimL family protein N-acetyltransferase
VAKWLLRGEDDWAVRVVVGPAATNRDEFDALAQSDPRLQIVNQPESMRPHFEWADTTVASPSTSVFEALHHGLVTGLVLTADNQQEVADDLLSLECACLIGDARRDGYVLDEGAWTALARQTDLRAKLSAKGAALVDGRGAERACDLLGLPEVFFRNASNADARLLWEWANDPLTRASSFSSTPIPWEEHEGWLRRRLAQSGPFYLAVDGGLTPLAVVRFDEKAGGTVLISYNLAPGVRGKDLSTLILGRACESFRRQNPRAEIHAWIKNDNLASQRCFVRAGFRELPDAAQPDRRLYVQSP